MAHRILNWLDRSLPTMGGRIATGAALNVAVITLLWPSANWTPDREKIFAVVAAIGAWLFSELKGAATPRKHDLDLFSAFRARQTDDARNFLRTQQFGVAFARNQMDGIREMDRWEGPPYEFIDRRIQKRWASLLAQIRAFSALVANYTMPLHGHHDMLTVHPPHGNHDDPEEWVIRQYEEMNEAANGLSTAADDFERYTRHRLGL